MSKKKATGDEKRVRTSIDDFLPAYLAACRDNVSLEDFAASIGVKPLTVTLRVNKLRAGGIDVPTMSGGSRVSVMERAAEIIARFKAENG